jgi:hypothetical protein
MNYAKLAKKADKLLAGAGQTVTVARYAPSRDSSTSVVTKGAATLSASASAVEIPVTQGLIQSFTVRLEEAIVLKTSRAFKLSPALGFRPLPRDEITLADGTIWGVTGCTFVSPAGIDLVYTIGVSK